MKPELLQKVNKWAAKECGLPYRVVKPHSNPIEYVYFTIEDARYREIVRERFEIETYRDDSPDYDLWVAADMCK